MKRTMLIAVCLGFALGLNVPAAEKPAPSDLAVLSSKTASRQDKVAAIDGYVRSVEQSAKTYTRKEAELSPGELKKVTDEKWSKIHTYSDGAMLKRMKMYPAAGSTRTEEFYYHDGKPVFVFLEDNGVGKENHDANAVGQKFYFANGKLVEALSADGQALDTQIAATKRMAKKLQKESTAFRAEVK